MINIQTVIVPQTYITDNYKKCEKTMFINDSEE